jgi:hypothetical protein
MCTHVFSGKYGVIRTSYEQYYFKSLLTTKIKDRGRSFIIYRLKEREHVCSEKAPIYRYFTTTGIPRNQGNSLRIALISEIPVVVKYAR